MLHLPRESVSSENARGRPSPIIAPANPSSKGKTQAWRSKEHPLLGEFSPASHPHYIRNFNTVSPTPSLIPAAQQEGAFDLALRRWRQIKKQLVFRLCKSSPVQAQRCIIPLCSQKTCGSTTGQLPAPLSSPGKWEPMGGQLSCRCLSSQTALPQPPPRNRRQH